MRVCQLITGLPGDKGAGAGVIERDALILPFQQWAPALQAALNFCNRAPGQCCEQHRVDRLAGSRQQRRKPPAGSVELLPPGLVKRLQPRRKCAGAEQPGRYQPDRQAHVQKRSLALRRDDAG